VERAAKRVAAMAKWMRDSPGVAENLRAEEFRELYGQGFMRASCLLLQAPPPRPRRRPPVSLPPPPPAPGCQRLTA